MSLWRAVQTRAWNAAAEDCAHPVFDHRGIEYLRAQVAAHDDAWTRWFAANGVEPLCVEYESFIAAHEDTVRRYQQLVIAAAQRQGDDRSARWVARFKEAA